MKKNFDINEFCIDDVLESFEKKSKKKQKDGDGKKKKKDKDKGGKKDKKGKKKKKDKRSAEDKMIDKMIDRNEKDARQRRKLIETSEPVVVRISV